MNRAPLRTIRRLAQLWPKAGLAVAAVIAWITQPLGRGVPPAQLAELFPELRRDPGSLAAARRRTWSTYVQGQALDAVLGQARTATAYPRVLPNPALHELRPPLILASFHIGALAALGAVLQELPGEVLVLHRAGYAPSERMALIDAGRTEWDRARSFYRALRTLRSGGFVFIALDGYDASTIDAPIFDRTVSLARGGFALARISGAPIVPFAARWAGTAVEVSYGDPIPSLPEEEPLAAAAAGWLERYLRERPGEISARTVEILHPQPGR